MLQWIVQHSLRFRGIVLALGAVLMAYGIYQSFHAKLDVFPDFVQPQAEIQSECPGMTAEQVETLVTRPVETAVAGTTGLENVRSESIQGLSVVTAIFKEGTDIFHARQTVAEKLTSVAAELPAGVKPPRMFPLVSSTMDVLKFGLTSKKMTPMQLRTFADWTVEPRLLAIPGVAKMSVFGGEVRQIQIQLHPEKLRAYDLTLAEVLDAARAATGIRGAGFLESSGQRLAIQTDGQALTAAAIGQTVIAHHDGKSLCLADVASVVDAAEPKFGDALINGEPGILLTAAGQYGANTMEISVALEQALNDMKPLFAAEGVEYVPDLHRPARFIENSLHNIRNSLLTGGLLVGAILFIFLLNVRTALISFVAIPLSLLTAVVILAHFGASLNTMTLGGFAVAIGVVVDDAIIDVENILRRLRENRKRAQPKSAFDVILHASLEVRSAVVYATFIVALVFVPVLTMTGLQGKFFAPLATAFILATMASLAVALTVTPALCYAFLSRLEAHEEPRYILWLKGRHRAVLLFISRWPRAIIGAVVLLVAAAVATLPFFGGEFLPEFREGHFVLQIVTLPGTSLPEMRRLGQLISRELLRNPHIKSVEQQIGRAEMGEDTWGPHQSEMHVELKPVSGEEEEQVEKEIRRTLASFPGIQYDVLTFLGDRIGETISGETAQIVINVFCDNLDAADNTARQIAGILAGVHGAADVQVNAAAGAPRVGIRLKPDRLREFGFRSVDVLDAIETAYQGTITGQVYEGNRVIDIDVRLAAGRPENLLLQNAEGLRLPLGQLAEIYPASGRYSISHEGARRRQTVTANARGRDVTSVVAEARQKISAIPLPAGAYLVYSGAAEQQSQAQSELLLHSLIAAAGILLLLAALFHNWRNMALILANIPFALVGGVLAAFLTGYFGDTGQGSLSLGVLVGFVTLFGITARNAIMMISHFEHLVTQEGMAWGLETALRGAAERLVPILMTALVTGLGLLPLALGSGEAGGEIEGPMAIVILGGLITSTALNLLVLPALALRYGDFSPAPPPG
ncbi:MAG TPA: efflux RND transporter permease subunit [Verrucomicrobiae bacterium]|jgi:CzcA family heavy metal efflux pump|nr:efflux RND transporter permease subunit [Verrucomicrobiae bacterium]